MKSISRTSQFKKDVKRMVKRGYDFSVFKRMIQSLVNGEQLERRYHNHPLIGQYSGTRECHIESDWLLIYESTKVEVILIRTGTHADLFQ